MLVYDPRWLPEVMTARSEVAGVLQICDVPTLKQRWSVLTTIIMMYHY
jgi:hypothetical protein